MSIRQDYFGRAVGTLSRALRGVGRYQHALDPDRVQQAHLDRACRHISWAMAALEEANRLAREHERAPAGPAAGGGGGADDDDSGPGDDVG